MRMTWLLVGLLLYVPHARGDLLEDFNDGRRAYQDGRYDEAVALFTSCSRERPDDELIGAWLGTALLRAERVDDAWTVLQAVVTAHPDNAVARNNLGLALLRKRSVDPAVIEFRQALHYNPDYFEARQNLASLYLDSGRFREAESVWRERLETHPEDAAARTALALVLEAVGRYDEALEEAVAAAGPRPRDLGPRALVARLRALSGDAPAAVEEMTALESEGPVPAATREAFAVALARVGEARLAAARFEDPMLRPYLTATGLAGYAEALQDLERWEDMEDALAAALVRPEFTTAWTADDQARVHARLAWLAARRGDQARAEACARAALDLDPEQTVARGVLEALGGEEDALPRLETEAAAGRAGLEAMKQYVAEAAARPAYIPPAAVLPALEGLGSEDPALLVRIAVLLLRADRVEPAVVKLERATALDPESAAAHNNLGVAYEALGRADDARVEYARAVRIDPECTEARANLARLQGEGDV